MPAPTLIQYNNYVFEKLTTRTPKVLFNTTQTNLDYPLLRKLGRYVIGGSDTSHRFLAVRTSDQASVRFVSRHSRGQINNLMRNLNKGEYGFTPSPLGMTWDPNNSYPRQYVFYSDDFKGFNPGNYSNFQHVNKNYGGPSRGGTQGDRIRLLKLNAQLQNFRPTKR